MINRFTTGRLFPGLKSKSKFPPVSYMESQNQSTNEMAPSTSSAAVRIASEEEPTKQEYRRTVRSATRSSSILKPSNQEVSAKSPKIVSYSQETCENESPINSPINRSKGPHKSTGRRSALASIMYRTYSNSDNKTGYPITEKFLNTSITPTTTDGEEGEFENRLRRCVDFGQPTKNFRVSMPHENQLPKLTDTEAFTILKAGNGLRADKVYPLDLTRFAAIDLPRWPENEFTFLKKLSTAIHGEVVLLLNNVTNEKLVCKQIRLSSFRPRKPGELENSMVEVGALVYLFSNIANVKPRFIAKPLGMYKDDEYVYFLMEFCQGGELFYHIVQNPIPEKLAKLIGLQLALALLSLHINGICHRDVSLENTLIYSDGTIRLIDFGQAESIYDKNGRVRLMNGSAGKTYYRSPEMAHGAYHGPAADVFALAVQLFIMVVGSPPWNESLTKDSRYVRAVSHRDGLHRMLKDWNKRHLVSNSLLSMLTDIFRSKPGARPSIQQMLLHPWFADDTDVWNWLCVAAPSALLCAQLQSVIQHRRLRYTQDSQNASDNSDQVSMILRQNQRDRDRDARQDSISNIVYATEHLRAEHTVCAPQSHRFRQSEHSSSYTPPHNRRYQDHLVRPFHPLQPTHNL